MPKSGNYYIKEAEKAGLRVVNGKGDHVKIYAPEGRGYMVVPRHRELSNGVECVVRKWLKAAGVLVTLSILLYLLIH